jgi:hypothetical protein
MGGSVYRRMIRYVTVLHADGSSEYGRDGRERPSMHDPGSIGSEIWRSRSDYVDLCHGERFRNARGATGLLVVHLMIVMASVVEHCAGVNATLRAKPDTRLLSQAPKNPHRRSSLCSLRVPKQSEERLEIVSFAQPSLA